MAMLTGAVNIAVFAAFCCVIGGVLLSDAEFKRVCGLRELDVWCYGWQKRHDRGKKWQQSGKVGGKNGKVRRASRAFMPPCPRVQCGQVARVRHDMRLSRCWRRRWHRNDRT